MNKWIYAAVGASLGAVNTVYTYNSIAGNWQDKSFAVVLTLAGLTLYAAAGSAWKMRSWGYALVLVAGGIVANAVSITSAYNRQVQASTDMIESMVHQNEIITRAKSDLASMTAKIAELDGQIAKEESPVCNREPTKRHPSWCPKRDRLIAQKKEIKAQLPSVKLKASGQLRIVPKVTLAQSLYRIGVAIVLELGGVLVGIATSVQPGGAKYPGPPSPAEPVPSGILRKNHSKFRKMRMHVWQNEGRVSQRELARMFAVSPTTAGAWLDKMPQYRTQ